MRFELPSRIHVSGGGALSPVWRQIQADVFNRVVATLPSSEDASALGAGIVAGTAIGLWSSAAEAVSLLKTRTLDEPVEAHARQYDALFASYRKLYPALKSVYDDLAGNTGSAQV